MKYQALYTPGNDFPYWNEIDEICINYNEKDTSLPQFLEEFKDSNVNLLIKKEDELERLKLLKEKYNFKIGFYYTPELVEAALTNDFTFFFLDNVTSWDVFIGLMQYHPTSICLLEDMCFNLADAKKIAKKYDVEIRVVPCVAQSSWIYTPSIKTFFIRPEDTEVYEPFADIYDLTAMTDKLKTIYEVYAKDKHWFGLLNEIILFFDDNIDNRRIQSTFAYPRTNCGKRCLKGVPCALCDRTSDLAKTLGENDIIFTPKNSL